MAGRHVRRAPPSPTALSAPATWSGRRGAARRVSPALAKQLLRLAAAALALFTILAYQARGEAPLRWESVAVEYFDRHYYDFSALRRVAEFLVYLGLVVGAASAVLMLVVLGARGLRRQALFWGLAVVGPILLTPVLKWAVGRPQIGADPEGDYSFPSGNAMVSLAFVAALVLLVPTLRRATALPAVVLTVAYGAALVLLLWHYPSDVLAGWCAALAWVAVVWTSLGAPVVSERALLEGFAAPKA
jgi:membrane-associated phospholipid phosphatase